MRLRSIVSVASFAAAVCCGVSFCQAMGQSATGQAAMNGAAIADDAGKISKPIQLPLNFEENRGQAPSGVKYLAHSGHGVIAFYADRVELPCGDSTAELRIEGAHEGELHGEDPGPGVANYYSGRDRAKWIEGVPLDERLRYAGVARGLDLLFHGNAGQLEYDLEVAPGADAAAVKFAAGADERVALNQDGSATVTAKTGGCVKDGVRMKAPVAYQTIGGKRVAVTAKFMQQKDGALGFEVGAYDHRLPLVIDPVVEYATFIIEGSSTTVSSIAADSAGDVFITGTTWATNYPVVNGESDPNKGRDQVFATKLDPTGSNILWSTYLPSGGDGEPGQIVVDPAGNAYVTGAADFSGFAVKLSSTGSMVYSIPLGSGEQLPKAAIVDANGYLYVAGLTADSGLQAVNGYSGNYGAGECTNCAGAFYGKLNQAGTGWVYSSYFTAPYGTFSDETYATAIGLDASGDLYIAGTGNGVPAMLPLERRVGNSFVAEFAADGKTLLFSTTINGEYPYGLQVGADGTIYVAGQESEDDFPFTANALLLPNHHNSSGGFAMAINPAHTGLTYSTYLGPGSVNGTTMDANGNLYLAGRYSQNGIPLLNSVVTGMSSGGYVIELNSAGSLLFSTAYGGTDISEVPVGVALDGAGNIYIAGTPGTMNAPVSDLISNQTVDPIEVGTGIAYSAQPGIAIEVENMGIAASSFITKIAPTNAPQISLSYEPPDLELRNVGTAALDISSITVGGYYTGQINNCGNTVAGGAACFIYVNDIYSGFGVPASGTVTITSNATPNVQTFSPSASYMNYQQNLWVSTEALYFPPTEVGTTSAALPYALWNVGSAPLTITSVQATTGASQTNNCATLQPMTSCTINVTVTPQTNIAGGYVNVAYAGANTSPTPLLFSAQVNLNQNSGPLQLSWGIANFGNVTMGQSSLPRVLNIVNSGTSAVSVQTPTMPAGFTLPANSCSGVSLAPQANCTMTFGFTPLLPKLTTGTVTIAGGGASDTVTLNGTGMATVTATLTPNWTTPPTPIFLIGMPAQQSFTLTNTSAVNVTPTSIVLGPVLGGGNLQTYTDSETDNCTDAVLAPGGTCTVTVAFDMTALDFLATYGSLIVQVEAILNGGDGLVTANAGGAVYYPITSSSGYVQFPLQYINTTSTTPQQITLTNLASTTQGLQLSTTGDFSIQSTTCGATMLTKTTCTVSLVFTPTTESAERGTLVIQDTGISQSEVVTLAGAVYGPVESVSATLINFGNETVGLTAATQTITMNSSGAVGLSNVLVTPGGTNSADFPYASTCATILAANASCTVTVSFKPSVATAESATLTFSSNGMNSPQVVTLSGTGVAPDFSVGATAAAQTVTPGANATYALSFPSTLTGTLTLSCSGLPQYASCSFTPQSVTLSTTTAAASTLTISTEQTVTSEARPMARPEPGMGAGVLALAGCLMVGGYRRRRWLPMLVALLALTLGGMAACGGGSGAGGGGSKTTTNMTPAGTYTITVTATMGTDVHTLPVTLIVN